MGRRLLQREAADARAHSDKKPVIAALIPKRSAHLRLEEVEFVPGPSRASGS
jgi:hypothetical protein